MISFPNCKINLGLHVVAKRADGYHNIETAFLPIPWQDALEIIPNKEQGNGEVTFVSTGIPLPDDAANNLCVKAYKLLHQQYNLPSIHMHLHKHIPIGAGLGGGSANAAFTLTMLNQLFNLQLSTTALIAYALQLGSDCPFFVENVPAYATGRGEVLQPIHLPLSKYVVAIINPQIHVPTGWAFQQITPTTSTKNIQEILQQPIDTWKENLVNDFQQPIVKVYPAIEAIVAKLYAAGALYAAMSGSGSTVFGIFAPDSVPVLHLPGNYLHKIVTLP